MRQMYKIYVNESLLILCSDEQFQKTGFKDQYLSFIYTGNRKSGGKPVREWSMDAGIIADMAIRLEMVRGTA